MAQVWSHVYKCRVDQLDLKGPEAAYWIKKGILSTGDPYCVFRGLGAAIHKPSRFNLSHDTKQAEQAKLSELSYVSYAK